MSTRYLQILAVQRPFPIGPDENNRVMFSMNFTALAAGDVDQWEEEVAKLISDAGLGTRNSDLFIGPKSLIPNGSGPFVSLIDTGGTAPDETHNGSIYERLSLQAVVRAEKYQDARTRALAIWRALDGNRNVTVAA